MSITEGTERTQEQNWSKFLQRMLTRHDMRILLWVSHFETVPTTFNIQKKQMQLLSQKANPHEKCKKLRPT